jgi:hypothetical protein
MIALTSPRVLASRMLLAVGPWYDWGKINVVNMDAPSLDEEVEGDVRYFDLQWLGIHLSIQFGRAPRAGGRR